MRKYNAAKTAVPGCRFEKRRVRGWRPTRLYVTVSAEQGRRYHVGRRKPVTLHPRASCSRLAIRRVPGGRHGVGEHAATSPRSLYHHGGIPDVTRCRFRWKPPAQQSRRRYICNQFRICSTRRTLFILYTGYPGR